MAVTISDEQITDEMRLAVARALYNEEDVNEMSCHPSTWEVIAALYPLIAAAQIEACAAVAKKTVAYYRVDGETLATIPSREQIADAILALKEK